MFNKARQRTAQLLEAHIPNDPPGRFIDIALILLIMINIVAIILQTVESIDAQYSNWFAGIELFSIAVFSVEYLLRLWSCVDEPRYENFKPGHARLKWAMSPLGLIDLLAILPFFLFMLTPGTSESLLMLRVFRGLRLLRLFKLTRYSPAFNVLASVLIKEMRVLLVAASILISLLIMAAWGMYMLERDIQPDVFGSIPASMWWAVISLTTVGYGDVVPVSDLGKVFAGIVALLGIGMMALPAAILASGFYREVHHRSQTYAHAVEAALQDGRLSDQDEVELDELRDALGIDVRSAETTRMKALRDHLQSMRCPHCGENIRNP